VGVVSFAAKVQAEQALGTSLGIDPCVDELIHAELIDRVRFITAARADPR
jgi:hypothetical protein